MGQVARLLEDQERVAAFDRALKKDKSAALEHAAAVRERYARQKVTTLPGIGWPLRPLFVPGHAMDFIGRSVHAQFDALRHVVAKRTRQLDALVEDIPVKRAVYENIDVKKGLLSPDFLAILRPDGFLFENGFLLTEVNFGNGTLVSNAYSETLYSLFNGSPVMKSLGWSAARGIKRPFPSMVKMLQRRLPRRKSGKYRVALLAHSVEHATIMGWEERVIQQVYFAQRLLARKGIETALVHEDSLQVDRQGVTRTRHDGKPVDAVMMITIGTSFMDEPERLKKDLRMLRGDLVGKVRFIKPLASLLMDKGTMPYMHRALEWPVHDGNGFHFDLASTAYPQPEHAVEYRVNREQYVLKRAFDGKHTFIGCSTPGRQWNNVLDDAVASRDYVVQEYASLPQTIMPVTPDGKHIEWIPVRVELSPFIIDGEYAGAIARYAPDAEGLILSPPPPDMGMTCVFST